MIEKRKFLDYAGLSQIIGCINNLFASKNHNHSISDITNLQTSLNGKQPIITGGASTIASDNLTGNKAIVSNSSGKVTTSTTTATELGYLSGVTNNVQTQLDSKSPSSHGHNVATPYVSSTNTGSNGFLSASDKAKLDGIASNANNYSLPSAGTSLGGVKTGGDVTISSGVITVNDDSHNHVINNVDGLQSALDGKASSSHNHSASNITSGTLSADRLPAIPVNKLSGVIDAANLPSYVDDVLEYTAKSNFPSTGETGKIYVDTTTNKTYRWSGTTYVEISESLALGTTSSTAYRGDFGHSAYTHAVTNKGKAFSSGLYKITTNSEGHVTAASAVAKSDITGLGIPSENTWRPVVDNLTSTSTTDSLSANQGKVLKGQVDGKLDKTGGTVTGTLILSRTTDANGTLDNKPALMIGDTSGTHIEIDNNEIMAKASGTTTSALYLNSEGGQVHINNVLAAKGASKGSATQPVYTDANGNITACTYSLNKTVPSNALFTDTNTHYASNTIVNSSNTATSNSTTALTNGNVFLNHVENGAVRNSHKISGSGATTVTTDTSGNIIISSTDTNTNTWRPVVDSLTSTATDSSLSANQGSVLKSLIDGKADAHTHPYASSSHTHDDRYYTESEIDTKLSGKSNAGHTHDDRYYTESEIDTKLGGKANANHGNHVPDYCTKITDWNSAIKNGWYMASDASNAPTTGWLYGEVISHNSVWCRQIVYKFAQGDSDITSGNNDKYERVFYNGTWGSWYNTSVRKAVPQNAVFTDTNTKVTSAANHYAPSADGNSGLNASASSTTAATWNSTSLVTGVNLERDSKGHVTGLSVNSIKMPANPNTDTHHTAKNIVGASSSATADATATNGNVWLNLIENGAVRSNTNIKGSGATTVTSDSSGNIVISSTDNNTTYSAGTGISLSGTQFSNSGVRSISTGTANGTISVNTNGTSTDVSIKGLGSAAYTASSAYASSGHTHNYAGSSTAGGSATSAVKLDTSTAGSTVQPVYFTNGVPTACTYTLGKSVPSNAVFTDTNTAVTQTISTTTNADYRVLLSGTADNTTRTEGARKDADFTYNPSTNTLSVTKVKMGSATMSYDSTAGAVVISFS